MLWITRTCICLLMCVSILGLKVKLEMARVVSFNPKYLSSAYVNVTRYGRRSNYYLNIEFVNKQTITNNVTVTVKVFEFRWNTYKSSIVGFRHKFCDFIERDQYIGSVIGVGGLKCPVKPAKHTVMNLTAHMDDFPSPFPFEKGRANFLFNVTSSGESVAEVVLYIGIKNEIKSKKRV